MKSLLDGVKATMTNAILDKAADSLGIESKWIKTGMKTFLPALIGGVINKGSSSSGAGGLLDLFKSGGFGDSNLGDLMGVLGSPEKTSGLLDTGGNLLSMLFGNKTNGFVDMLVNMTGMKDGVAKTLLKFLAPMVINKLAGITSSNNLDANGLSSYLNGQKSDVMGLVPGLSGFFGGSDDNKKVAAAATSSSTTSRNTSTETSSSNEGGGGMGWLKWLIPLLLVALAGYMLSQDGCGEKTDAKADTTTETTTETTDNKTTTPAKADETTTIKTATPAAGEADGGTVAKVDYSLAANGDLVNSAGSVVYAYGSYSIDAAGNVVSKDGRILISVSALSDDLLGKLKAKFGNLSGGVTLEQMQSMFADMLAKKPEAKASYGLSDIEFNTENHKISNFSKAEVQGLAAALKANAKGKIEVQCYTADGKDDKESKELSQKRAQVVMDMLVTLGVTKGQISAKGMGNENAAKAGLGKVEIAIK